MDPDPEVLNYESGSGLRSKSLLFIKDLKNFKKKVKYFIVFFPLPDGLLASPLTDGPRSDWT